MSWDRVLAPAATLAVPVALVMLFFGQVYGAAGAATVVVALALVIVPRRERSLDLDWVAPAASVEGAPGPTRGSVGLALAPVEARELLLSPWFGAGVGFCVLFGALGVPSFERSWWVTAGLMPLLVHPLCGMVIVATHRNVTRSRRDHTDELFDSCPASSGQRVGGHLLTAIVPIAVSTLFVTSTLLAVSVVVDDIYGPVDRRVFADAAIAGVLLPAGAIGLGVFLGRRVRFALAPFIVLAVIAILDLEMWDRGLDGRGWLATGIASGGIDFIYVEPPVIGRLVWFSGLIVLMAGLAFTATNWSRTRLLVSAGVLVSALGLVATVRPMTDATADRLAEYVIAPDAHEVCERLTVDVEVCALRPYSEHGANVAARIAPVAAALPRDTFATPITMRLLVGEHIDQLPDQVQQRIVPTPIPAGTVGMPFTHHEGSLDAARFILAATAVGIPTGGDAPENVLVDGEARGVIMLWLTTTGLTDSEALDLLEPDEYNENSPSGRGHVWPGVCGAPVQWAPQDIAAARILVGLDRGDVAAIVAEQWQHWVVPGTTTDELLVAVGVGPIGPPDQIEPLGSPC